MSKSIKPLGVLSPNPFILGHVLYSFYKDLPPMDKGVLLSYLVFPLSLYPSSQQFLKNSTSRSSMRTLASVHDRLFGLEERIQE